MLSKFGVAQKYKKGIVAKSTVGILYSNCLSSSCGGALYERVEGLRMSNHGSLEV